MSAEFVRLYEKGTDEKQIQRIAKMLQEGAVIIYPTDTVYGMGCDFKNGKAIERVARLKGLKPDKAFFSIICHDLSNLSEYTTTLSQKVFKAMKRALPGPYTFICNANSQIPKVLNQKKKTIGIRIPDNAIPRLLVKELGNPIITTSIIDEDDVIEYSTDPELIFERYKNQVDLIIDGGPGGNIASTVFECTDSDIELIREGAGDPQIVLE